jgi:hypothetical protein
MLEHTPVKSLTPVAFLNAKNDLPDQMNSVAMSRYTPLHPQYCYNDGGRSDASTFPENLAPPMKKKRTPNNNNTAPFFDLSNLVPRLLPLLLQPICPIAPIIQYLPLPLAKHPRPLDQAHIVNQPQQTCTTALHQNVTSRSGDGASSCDTLKSNMV